MSGHLPLSRLIDVGAIPPGGTARQVVASEAERGALAKALDILDVESLDAQLSIAPWRTEGVSITGHLRARVVQSCVVSLEPVAQEIDEAIDARFVPAGSKLAQATDAHGHSVVVAPEDVDAPEIFSGHSIDVGELVAEHLALALDPYPRAPGAELPPEFHEKEAEEPAASSPFAVLERLKKDRDIKG